MSSGDSHSEYGLRHQLSAGQMTMVAVGGSIGTGLLLGTAAAIELAGPAVILSFILAAFKSAGDIDQETLRRDKRTGLL